MIKKNILYTAKSLAKQQLEYYFIIEFKKQSVGTVRLYNINHKDKSFEWGSWIIVPQQPITVALNSVYLSYMFAFNYLKLDTAYINAKIQNKSALRFYLTFSKHKHTDNEYYYLECTKENFEHFIHLYNKKICLSISVK